MQARKKLFDEGGEDGPHHLVGVRFGRLGLQVRVQNSPDVLHGLEISKRWVFIIRISIKWSIAHEKKIIVVTLTRPNSV